MKECKEIQMLEKAHEKKGIPFFRVGDTLNVYTRIVEGEKDADSLMAIGLVGTTNLDGAGKRLESYNQCFRGKDV